jgi:hypothetical protein
MALNDNFVHLISLFCIPLIHLFKGEGLILLNEESANFKCFGQEGYRIKFLYSLVLSLGASVYYIFSKGYGLYCYVNKCTIRIKFNLA